MARQLKIKYIICCELIEMCNLINVELGYFSNDTRLIISNLANEPTLSHLDFLKSINLEAIDIKTELNSSENEKINALFKKMGSTDASSMIDLVNSFRASVEESKERYGQYVKSRSRLYVAFGFFGGLAVSVVLI